jgi:hypothetical protein
MQHLFNALFSLKSWLLKVLALFMVWFEPAKELALMLVVFVLIDAVLDVWVKIDKKIKIVWKAFLIKQIRDITLFLLYILVIHYFQVSYLKEEMMVFKLLVGIPLVALLSGIVTNIETLTGITVATQVKELLTSIIAGLKNKAIKKED